MSALRVCGLLGLLLGEGAPVVAQAPVRAAPSDLIQVAYLDFERTGKARVIQPRMDGGYILFPYGHVRPTLRCPLLNACVIVLDPDEALTDEPLSGDTERWIIDTSVMGSEERSVLVVVKPQFCGIATNLVIPTSRRIYELALVSDLCEGKSRGESEGGDYTRQMRFWYPDEMRAARRIEEEIAAAQADAAETLEGPELVLDLNRDYEVERGWWWNRKRYPWIPEEVFDDGIRTYVVIPEAARHGELPILYTLENGERHVLNYALRGDTIVADRVLERAVLVVGKAGGDETIEIRNRDPLRREDGNP